MENFSDINYKFATAIDLAKQMPYKDQITDFTAHVRNYFRVTI